MIRAIVLFVLGTLFFSALLTPLACSAIIAIQGDLPWPFSRVYDRVALVVAIVMLVLLRRSIDLSAVKELSFRRPLRERVNHLIIGVTFSIIFVLPILPWVVDGTSLTWRLDEGVGYYVSKAAKAVLSGLIISILEECFFRIVVFQNLKRFMSVFAAALGSSILYSVVHFIRPDKSFTYADFSLLAGFEYTLAVVQSALFLDFLPAFFGLLVVGLILCFVIHRTGSLYLCIGLHTGWVIAMKMTHYGTDIVPGSPLATLGTRRYDLVSQPEVWLSFVFTFGALYWMTTRMKKMEAAHV